MPLNFIIGFNSIIFVIVIAFIIFSVYSNMKRKEREAEEEEERKRKEVIDKKTIVGTKTSTLASGAKAASKGEGVFTKDPLMKPGSISSNIGKSNSTLKDEGVFTSDPLMKPGSISSNIGKKNLLVMAPHQNPYAAKNKTANEEHVHPTTGKVRIEKAFTTNSAGGAITEGCGEHYYDRAILQKETLSEAAEMTDLQKIFIYGDLINKRVGR